jgi:PKD repeat protein
LKKFYGYTKHKVSQYAETKYFTIGFKEKEIDLPKGFGVFSAIPMSNHLLSKTWVNIFILPDDVPKDVMQAITHWSQWIDYWAVDFNYHDDTFHNEWQSYRTKKSPDLELTVAHYYPKKGTYTVLVKVIDILGNDTTKLLDIVVS